MLTAPARLGVCQVIIEGFKSYKEQVAIEPFSPKHNCIGTCAYHISSCPQKLCAYSSSFCGARLAVQLTLRLFAFHAPFHPWPCVSVA
jgi:hypothetical protein